MTRTTKPNAKGKLGIFISCSGPRSEEIATALRDWLPYVFQSVQPWLAAVDIEKGANWVQVLTGHLERADFAIICLTPENLNAPWIHFEAGAVSKRTESRVCTYTFDLEFTSITYPLSAFQYTKAVKEDTKKLVETINSALTARGDNLESTLLSKSFERWWPDLESKLEDVRRRQVPRVDGPKPNEILTMMKETLTIVRELSKLAAQQSVGVQNAPLFLSEAQVEEIELAAKQQVIVVTRDLKFDNRISDVVQKNARNGVKYVYLMPKDGGNRSIAKIFLANDPDARKNLEFLYPRDYYFPVDMVMYDPVGEGLCGYLCLPGDFSTLRIGIRDNHALRSAASSLMKLVNSLRKGTKALKE